MGGRPPETPRIDRLDGRFTVKQGDTPHVTMVEVRVPFLGSPSAKEIEDVLDENGQVRLSELKDELPETDDVARALLDLVERGKVAVFPVGDVVVVKPVDDP